MLARRKLFLEKRCRFRVSEAPSNDVAAILAPARHALWARAGYNLAASFAPSECLIVSADESPEITSSVFGSIRLTEDAAPCEPYCASMLF